MSVYTDLESILDNGGETFDRYTISFHTYDDVTDESEFFCYGASENPFHPQGFGQHAGDYSFPDTDENPEIGQPVDRSDVPEQVQKLIAQIEAQSTWETVTCDLCDDQAKADDAIHTECGATVGECCHDQLRVVTCDEQGESWYYVN